MKWLYRNLYRKEKGFTLVELMIVIIILAILTGIAVPSYMILRDRARVVAAKAELKNIATALSMYNADNEEYPATGLAAMITALETPSADGNVYMAQVPDTDDWAKPYVYVSDTITYTITCTGADGAAGGGDDWIIEDGNQNW